MQAAIAIESCIRALFGIGSVFWRFLVERRCEGPGGGWNAYSALAVHDKQNKIRRLPTQLESNISSFQRVHGGRSPRS